jgi:very-short-patch-repair endonuclease
MDIWIPSLQVNIEVDGPHHKKQKEKDAQRDKMLKESYGIQVIRIDLVGTTTDELIEKTKSIVEDLLKKTIPSP